jgi:hypothetical protein
MVVAFEIQLPSLDTVSIEILSIDLLLYIKFWFH